MKTIKEKAKAYDEALKVLHKYDGANIMFSQSLKEEMFPELKESEDEKIRKSLIQQFNALNTLEVWGGIKRTDIIAWLEKQGEQKPVEWETVDEQNLNAVFSYIKDEYLRKWLKNILFVKHTKYVEWKWSKEDEKILDRILTTLRSCAFTEEYPKLLNWLKKICGKIEESK